MHCRLLKKKKKKKKVLKITLINLKSNKWGVLTF